MSNAFVQQDAVQHLLRESAGLNATGGDERFKMIVHRLLENLCTLIDDYNVTEEEFWHAVNYLHELGGRQEAALLARASALNTSSTCARTRLMPQRSGKPAPLVPLKARCTWRMRRWQTDIPAWMMVKMRGR
ncbi:catechol 1,2-dioxygenase [Klebsiella michiganensis]|uniref:Catechol 1,2-dioxygenase n=1 Tax=Klebsiella michiganensis TaxID=1134687 RepID=A0A7H4LT67_9ENTR|nr:catechol 1,2-dioxygenase [Klebsiella michiganensis]